MKGSNLLRLALSVIGLAGVMIALSLAILAVPL